MGRLPENQDNLIKVCTADLIRKVPCRINPGVAKKFQPIISLGKKEAAGCIYKSSENKTTAVNKLVKENTMTVSFPPNHSLFKFKGSTQMAFYTRVHSLCS